MADFLSCFPSKKLTDNSRFVDVKDLKDYDLSAKNPHRIKEKMHRSPAEILDDIEINNKRIETLIGEIRNCVSMENGD
jgi:type I restriction enzyme M protein